MMLQLKRTKEGSRKFASTDRDIPNRMLLLRSLKLQFRYSTHALTEKYRVIARHASSYDLFSMQLSLPTACPSTYSFIIAPYITHDHGCTITDAHSYVQVALKCAIEPAVSRCMSKLVAMQAVEEVSNLCQRAYVIVETLNTDAAAATVSTTTLPVLLEKD